MLYSTKREKQLHFIFLCGIALKGIDRVKPGYV